MLYKNNNILINFIISLIIFLYFKLVKINYYGWGFNSGI